MKSIIMVLVLITSSVSSYIVSAQPGTSHPVKNNTMETSSEKNKAIIRSLYDNILNNRRFELLPDLVSNNYRNSQGATGSVGFSKQVLEFIGAFPDARWTIIDLIAEGNKVFVRQKVTGTHTKPFQNIAATNRFITNEGTGMYEFENGQIIYSHVQTDRLGFLQQLELIPTDITGGSADKLDQVIFVDRFVVPTASMVEFKRQTQINRSFIKTLPGFVKDEAMVHSDSTGNLIMLTFAVWRNQDYLNKAKAAVQAEYQRINFNPQAFLEKLGVTMERNLYTTL